MCEHVGLQLMIIFNTVDTIKSNPHNHFMKNLISSLLTSQGFIIYFHRLHPKCLFFPLLSLCCYPMESEFVYAVVDCLKYLLAVKCFRFSSEGALHSQGAGIRPLCSLTVCPG